MTLEIGYHLIAVAGACSTLPLAAPYLSDIFNDGVCRNATSPL
jgi:hypothetical protein